MKKIMALSIIIIMLSFGLCTFASGKPELAAAELADGVSFVTEPRGGIALFSAEYNKADIFARLRRGFKNRDEMIVISDSPLVTDPTLSQDELQRQTGRLLAKIMTEAKYTFPELYCMENSFRWGTGGSKIVVFPTYTDDSETVEKKLRLYEAFKADILSRIDADMTDFQKAAAVHDYIVMNLKYDAQYKVYDAVNMAIGGSGVCQGYAQMFYDVCANHLGMGCGFVVGSNKTEGAAGHIWNVIKLDGKWYHIDATYDDPLVRYSDLSYADDVPLRAAHKYFLVSDEMLGKIDANDTIDRINIDSAVNCTDTYYDENRPWDDYSAAQLLAKDGADYYISGTEVVKNDGSVKSVYSFSRRYTTGGKVVCIGGIGIYGNALYIGDGSKIYAVNLSTGEKTQIYGCADGVVQHLRIDGGVLTFAVAEIGSGNFKVYGIPLGNAEGTILGAEIIGGRISALVRCAAENAALYTCDSNGDISSAAVVLGMNRISAEYGGENGTDMQFFLWTDGLCPLDAKR